MSPADYSPNLTVEDWVKLLGTRGFHQQPEIMKRMKDIGGIQFTAVEKYGETSNFYNIGSSSLQSGLQIRQVVGYAG